LNVHRDVIGSGRPGGRIDFPGHFGKPTAFHVIRARACDDLIRDHLARAGEQEPVVALDDGLDTQFWRIGDERLRWVSMDVPESIRCVVRCRCRTATLVSGSALDPVWMDAVPTNARPFITAAGLLMYFKREDVRRLLMQIAQRSQGLNCFSIRFTISFTTFHEGNQHHQASCHSPHAVGIRIDEIPEFVDAIPGLVPITVQAYTDLFPQRMRLYKTLSFVPAIRNLLAGSLVHRRVLIAEGDAKPDKTKGKDGHGDNMDPQ